MGRRRSGEMRPLRQRGAALCRSARAHELRQLPAPLRRQHLRQRHRPPHGQRPGRHEQPRRYPATPRRPSDQGGRQEPEEGANADEKVAVYQQPRTSIFDRPGFGSLAFRNSMAALADGPKAAVENSAGSAGSLKQRQLDPSDDGDDDDEESELTPLHFFLTAVGLEEFVEPFVKERFDLDSLMLVKESDLVDMHIPRGYRLKLMQAITQRRAALDDPSDLEDCYL